MIREHFNVNYAYNTIFLQSIGIIIGSIFAFLLSTSRCICISKIKKITSGKFIWLRATGSTVVSQLIDSFVVLLIAFIFSLLKENHGQFHKFLM